MRFPASDRVVFQRNPLVEVICQLQFPTVLAIASESPAAFQELIRDSYPLYRRDQPAMNLPIDLSAFIPNIGMSGVLDVVTHQFETEEAKRAVSLSKEFVAVTDHDYTRWERFREQVETAKDALEETYRPAFYSRVGLRYQDVIDKSALNLQDSEWTQLLNSALLGLIGAEIAISEGVNASSAQALIDLDDGVGGQARIACEFRREHDEETPHEIYRIDADFFTTGRLSGEEVFRALDAFNEQAGYFFRWAITSELSEALGPQPLE